jgi:acyl-CoA synthetase (AMP-forming)/AMP-acid ligase II
MLYPPGIDSVPAFFGATYAGLVPVPVIPPRPDQPPTALARILADAKADLILTTAATIERAQRQFHGSEFLTRFRWIATDTLAAQQPPYDVTPFVAQPDDLAVLLYTSGSTNFPKGVMLTHANLLNHLRAANEHFNPVPQDSMVAWMPLYHGSGLIGSVLHPMYSSVDVTILSALEVIQRPVHWLQTLSRLRATISSGPNFLYQACIDRITPAERADLDLSAWRFAFLGAEPIRAATLTRFYETFAPQGFRASAFHVAYGQSETTLLTTIRDSGMPDVLTLDRTALQRGQAVPAAPGESGQTLVSCGKPVVDTLVRIVDPQTHSLLPSDTIGEIWVQGPTVARGYWNNPDATREQFHAEIAATGEGPFFRTGDLGFLHAGELYIAGRLKDLIIVRGKNYYAQDVEAAVVSAHPALQPGAAAAFGIERDGAEAIVLMHEVHPDIDNLNVEEIAQALRAAAATALDLPLYAVVVVAANSLPRTPTGKIQRFLCRREFLAAYPGESA